MNHQFQVAILPTVHGLHVILLAIKLEPISQTHQVAQERPLLTAYLEHVVVLYIHLLMVHGQLV